MNFEANKKQKSRQINLKKGFTMGCPYSQKPPTIIWGMVDIVKKTFMMRTFTFFSHP